MGRRSKGWGGCPTSEDDLPGKCCRAGQGATGRMTYINTSTINTKGEELEKWGGVRSAAEGSERQRAL